MNKHEIGALLLRVVVGITFFVHGLQKFQGGIANVAGWFESIGLPGFLAYIVASIEVVGGIALIVGLFSNIVAFLFVFVMIGAILKVKLQGGFTGGDGYEFDLALLAMSGYLTIAGSKLYAVSNVFQRKAN